MQHHGRLRQEGHWPQTQRGDQDSLKSALQGTSSFATSFFSTSRVIILSLHHQSICYFCIHIFNTLHQLVTDVHVGSLCVLTFTATNLSRSSTERGNVNYRLFKVHVLHKYMGPKLFLGSSMNSNTPPPLYNPPCLLKQLHTFPPEKNIFWFLSTTYGFYRFFSCLQQASLVSQHL